MSEPLENVYFSVLIPTKNRSHLVGFAIQSVLNQTFEGYEIILVDNDDSEATDKVVQSFSDPRVRYFRTGGLNMSENWEFALNQAAGKYITVLEDKQAYYPYALESLKEMLDQNNHHIAIWEWDYFDDKKKQAYTVENQADSARVSSESILLSYLKTPNATWQKLPRMINSVASMSIINKIKANNGGHAFFSLVSPDLCAAFQLLAFSDSVLMTGGKYGLVGYNDLSNAKVVRRKQGDAKYFGDNAIISMAIDRVPVKELRLIHNTVYNEYLRIKDRVGAKLVKLGMDNYTYAKLCLHDLAVNYSNGYSLVGLKPTINYIRSEGLPIISMIVYFLTIYFRQLVVKYRIISLHKKIYWQGKTILDAVASHPKAKI